MDTMELKQLYLLLRRWMWLLVVGLLVGLLAGFVVSRVQEPVYQATSRLLVTRDSKADNPSFIGLDNEQLALTYVQLLKTRDLRLETAERVGVVISAEQVDVQLVPSTQIIEITVEYHDPQKVAEIANTMVAILIEENDSIVSGQYEVLENSLNTQITEVEEQIQSLQTDFEQAYLQNYEDQVSTVAGQIASLQAELTTLQSEIAPLEYKLALFNQNPLINLFTLEERVQLAEKRARVEQLQSVISIYNELQAGLLVSGRPLQASQLEDDQQFQQINSTIDLYQEMYLDLLSNLEAIRLARLQYTPTVAQIEEAFVPQNPVRPSFILNLIISGAAGLILAGIAALLLNVWGEIVSSMDVLPSKPVSAND